MNKILAFVIAVALLSIFLGTVALAVPYDPGIESVPYDPGMPD